jgi:hypothetical protein
MTKNDTTTQHTQRFTRTDDKNRHNSGLAKGGLTYFVETFALPMNFSAKDSVKNNFLISKHGRGCWL